MPYFVPFNLKPMTLLGNLTLQAYIKYTSSRLWFVWVELGYVICEVFDVHGIVIKWWWLLLKLLKKATKNVYLEKNLQEGVSNLAVFLNCIHGMSDTWYIWMSWISIMQEVLEHNIILNGTDLIYNNLPWNIK